MEKLSRYTFFVLILLGLVIEFAVWRLAEFNDVKGGLTEFYIYFGAAFLLYVSALVYLTLYWHRSFFSPELIIVFGVIFRFTMLFADPVFSDDVCRYIWDGRVANAGINPYAYEPDSENLKGLRDETIFPHVNHRDVHTIYPPVLQYLFRLTTSISESVTVMKLVMTLFDCALMILLLALLRTLERPRGWVLAYAWNPLIFLEVAGNGHADVIGVFFLMLGLWFALRSKPFHAVIALVVSLLSKFMAFATVPFIEDFPTRLKQWVYMIVTLLGVALLLYVPFLDAGTNLWKGLSTYIADWEFNSFFYKHTFTYYKGILPDAGPTEYWMGFAIENPARVAAKLTLAGAGFLLFAFLFVSHLRKSYAQQKNSLLGVSFILTAAILLLNPTLHPWYLIWIAPFLCIYPNPAWILFTGLVTLSYSILPQYRSAGQWIEKPDILYWEYVPFLGILFAVWAYKTFKKWRSQPEEAHE